MRLNGVGERLLMTNPFPGSRIIGRDRSPPAQLTPVSWSVLRGGYGQCGGDTEVGLGRR